MGRPGFHVTFFIVHFFLITSPVDSTFSPESKVLGQRNPLGRGFFQRKKITQGLVDNICKLARIYQPPSFCQDHLSHLIGNPISPNFVQALGGVTCSEAIIRANILRKLDYGKKETPQSLNVQWSFGLGWYHLGRAEQTMKENKKVKVRDVEPFFAAALYNVTAGNLLATTLAEDGFRLTPDLQHDFGRLEDLCKILVAICKAGEAPGHLK